MTPTELAAIEAILGGWTNPVLADEAGGVIAGHARILAARQLGYGEVPVMVARGWSDAQKPQLPSAIRQSPEYFARTPVSCRNYRVDHTHAASTPSEPQRGADGVARGERIASGRNARRTNAVRSSPPRRQPIIDDIGAT
jgi:hypothetical protein